MRQMLIQVPAGRGGEVLRRADDCGLANTVVWQAADAERDWDLIVAHVTNDKVDDLLSALEPIPGLHLTLNTTGVLVLSPEAVAPPEPAFDVTPRSPIEIFLNRSLGEGEWRALAGYALVAGIVVWIGLYEEVIYLLTAAMLVAPFAGPALTTAVASASGDIPLLRKAVLRYLWTVLLSVLAAALLTLVAGMQLSTRLMVDVVSLSPYSLLLPVAAGAAGALFVVHSEESSSVSGAAVGMLVAAALAPPAGVLGMGMAMGEWALAGRAVFVIAAQLVGINLVASMVFRLHGMSPQRPTFSVGRRGVFPLAMTVSFVCLAVLAAAAVAVPGLQRDLTIRTATQEVSAVIAEAALGILVDADVRFAPYASDPDRIVATVHVEPPPGAEPAEVRDAVTAVVGESLRRTAPAARALVDVVVLHPEG
jgi:uncharacterized membrane protein